MTRNRGMARPRTFRAHPFYRNEREIASVLQEGSVHHIPQTCRTIRFGCITMRSTLVMIDMNGPDIETVDNVKTYRFAVWFLILEKKQRHIFWFLSFSSRAVIKAKG